MIEIARAKVNLYLHLAGRRPDGYHLIDSVAVFPGVADELSARPATHLTLEITGPFAAGLKSEPDNIVMRAARALAARSSQCGLGAHLTLDKRLPIASGIGGGSADAAATLRLLSRLWKLNFDASTLAELALPLGADIPVCMTARPQRMLGIGERLLPAPRMPPFAMVLVNPGVAVATADVFRLHQGGFSGTASLPDAWLSAASMAADLAAMTNDLEAASIALCPPVAEVLVALRAQPGCLLARMSGSGATCFGLFAEASSAAASATRLRTANWWCWSSPLNL